MEGMIYWAGVSFDAHDEVETDGFLDKQHTAITDWCGEQAIRRTPMETIDVPTGDIHVYSVPGLWQVLDIFDAMGSRIGFGIRVETITIGNQVLYAAGEWLRTIGLNLHVAVYEVNTENLLIARPAGVDDMLPLDMN